jgi:hypothetical protein
MPRRSAKAKAMTRLIGHVFGVAGVIMGANAITAAINPHGVQAMSSGIEQGSAALMSIGFIALGLWLVTARTRTPQKPR